MSSFGGVGRLNQPWHYKMGPLALLSWLITCLTFGFMEDISTVNGVVFHQLCWWWVGRRDDRSWSTGNQPSWHLCCNSRFSGLTLEVPKRANTFGAILAIPILFFCNPFYKCVFSWLSRESRFLFAIRHHLVLYRLVHMVFRYNLKHERDQSSQTSLKPRGSSRDQEYIRSAEVALNSRCQVGGETGRRVQWM